MWHGGIHITEATTPWCALSGKSPLEALDFPVPFKGEQAVRCMADGEVVAYRVCKDYLMLGWNPARLAFPVRLFWLNTLFNRGRRNPAGCISIPCICTWLYSAYSVNPAETKWTVQDTLTAYDPEWVMTASTNNKSTSESYRRARSQKDSLLSGIKQTALHTVAFNKREYGLCYLC
jgi:hypothetical protein